ncbi:MAG: hypothetical protein DCC68_25195 [Planctomycetota bacterium]|nr:MAG: hypothetical protein DCC68_25195 [Planctomycetota bacterium]
MKNIHLIAACALTLGVVGVSTYYQGMATERWSNHNDSEALNAMAEKMKSVPLEFGEWEGKIIEDTPESLDGYRKARVKSHVDLEYTHTRTGEKLRVTLVCGHRNHIAQHTPDQCMVGAGFDKVDENMTFNAVLEDGVSLQGRTMQFMKRGEEGVINQRMIWTWTRDGRWIGPAADNRVVFSAHPAWYKLYVTMPLAGSKTKSDADEMKPFVREFVPALTKILYPAGIGSDDGDDASVL